MSETRITINRTLVGVLALCCLLAAAVIALGVPIGSKPEMWQGAFTRVGLLMSAFWLALPNGNRDAAWKDVSGSTFVALLLAVVAVIRLPLKIVVPVAVVLAIIGVVLRPRAKKRPGSR